MSYREVSMLEIKEVLRRKESGSSARRIARDMGIDRKTVGRYLSAIAAAGVGCCASRQPRLPSALTIRRVELG